MLVICSSSVEDQAALIGDRKSCIQDLSIPLHDSKGTPIVDKLVFFFTKIRQHNRWKEAHSKVEHTNVDHVDVRLI